MSDAAEGPGAPGRCLHARLDLAASGWLLLLSICWGVAQVAVKVGNRGIPPLLQAGIRSTGAAFLLWAWSAALGVRLLQADGTLGHGALIAVLFASEFAFVYWGFVFTTASRGVLFLYAAPFVVALGAHWLVPGERLRPVKLLGLLCAFSGLAVAFADGLALPSRRALLGDALELVAAGLWGATTLAIKVSPHRLEPQRTLFYQLAGSGAILLPLAALAGDLGRVRFTPAVAAAIAYQTVVVAFASYLVWFWLLTRYPASHMHAFTFGAPLFGVLAGWLLLGEPVTSALAAAMVLVAAGIYLVNRAPRP